MSQDPQTGQDKQPTPEELADPLNPAGATAVHNIEPATGKIIKEETIMDSQTFGEKAVGLSFNPSGDSKVSEVKQSYAGIIDRLNEERSNTEDPEVKRQLSVAITEAQTSQMWAVKALTWQS